ncbi:FAD:protein FMN transferase [Acidovorax carolinensis]|uniref:FAD:protein FMN transferase n=1 Tax=Acidovorax carolinensis TaxID=553814 RepID=UPI000B343B05|nr:FAD:protein FMN transferase [Acidovorax carolinensis]ART47515.1 thiamine biosynthesis protein ApbE [Acidovorax carolinensis]
MKSAESTVFSPTRRRMAMALPLLGCVSWASADPVSRAPQRASRALMGTQVDIVADGEDGSVLRRAIDKAYAEMARLEALFSRYQPDSAVSRISRAAGVQPVAVPAEVMAVLKTAQQMFRLSDGAFDITVGSLKGWSFEAGQHTVPPASLVARQRQLVDARRLVLNESAGTAYLTRHDMALDLGGIAKLPILEAGMRVLRQQGVSNALINGGGDVLVVGQLQGRPWRVGLRDPRAPERLLGALSVQGQAVVASSGDYERYFFAAGKREHHILDPRTGYPTVGVHGVSLLARDVAQVNGLGAAMMVQGAKAGQALVARQPGVDALVVAGDGGAWYSAGMAVALGRGAG